MQKLEMSETSSTELIKPTFLQQHWQKLLALLIWGGLLAGYFWVSATYQIGPIQLLLLLIDVMRNSFYGPLIYIAIYAIRPFTFFSAGLLTISGGYLFGPVWGVIYSTVAGIFSSSVAYVIGRYFGGALLDSDKSTGVIAHYASRLRRNSFETVLIMRLLLLPYDFVNYLCGLLRIRYRAYLIASILGSIPGSIAFVLFGASVKDIDKLLLEGKLPSLDFRVLAASLAIFAVSVALSRYFKRREEAVQ